MSTNDDPAVGDHLDTPYGRGRVVSVTPSELTVWIAGRGNYRIQRKQQAPANHPFLARLRELGASVVGEPPTRPELAKSTSVPVKPTTSQTRAMAAVDALRLGTVPRFALREATIGREAQLQRVGKVFDASKKTGHGRTIVVTGPNGAGKTHMLPLVEQEALERNFVIARAELEGALKIAPKMVYQKLATNLVWVRNGERHEGTVEDFLLDHGDDMDKVQVEELAECPLLEKLVTDIRDANNIPDAVWDWVHGDDVYAGTLSKTGYKASWLKADGTHGQTVSNPMSGLARVSRDLGYGGLAVLLDEAELVLLQDARWAVIGREWLRGLVLAAEGGEFRSPAGAFNEGETPEYLQWNEWAGKYLYQPVIEYRLRYGGVDPKHVHSVAYDRAYLNHAAAGIVPLVLVLGYTSQDDSVQNVFDEQGDLAESWLPLGTVKDTYLQLPEMRRQDIEQLVERLTELYVTAYPQDRERVRAGLPQVADILSKQLSGQLHRGTIESIRGISQAILDILDRLATGYPAEKLKRILETAV